MGNGLTVEDPNSPVGQISGTNQGLAEFAGPYVTEMLGRGRALAEMPFQAYEGPLTAGASGLQDQAFNQYSQINAGLPTTVNTFGGDMTAGQQFGFGDAAGQQKNIDADQVLMMLSKRIG